MLRNTVRAQYDLLILMACVNFISGMTLV